MKETVSIVVPAHNEESSVVEVVAAIREVLKGTDYPYEIIIVDDGSTDRTVERLRDAKTETRIIEHGYHRGYGAALKTGIKSARHDIIVTIDADGSHPADQIPNLLRQIGDYDMVIGARTGKDTVTPFIRRPPKWVLRKLAEYLSEARIPDLNSGFRVMRKATVEKFMRLLPNGFSFSSTITIAMHVNDYKIRYFPVTCHKRSGGQSKIRPIRDTLNFFQLIIRTILYFAPLKIFLPASVLLFIASIGVLLYSYLIIGKILDITVMVLLLASIQVFSIGLLADLMDKRT
jgi:glycosyltransferase involved in cell wall biosynthesis